MAFSIDFFTDGNFAAADGHLRDDLWIGSDLFAHRATPVNLTGFYEDGYALVLDWPMLRLGGDTVC